MARTDHRSSRRLRLPRRPGCGQGRSGRGGGGFTLLELLITMVLSALVISAAGTAMVTHLRSGERSEALERQRADWSRSTFFLDAEVALSQAVISDAAGLAALTIPATCTGITKAQLRFALRLQPQLPLVLYAVKASDPPWLPANSLYRCGPDIDANGAYSDPTAQLRLLVDGLDAAAAGGGLSVDGGSDARRLTYTLGVLGLARMRYSQSSTSQGRVDPFYVRPVATGLCWSTTNITDPVSGLVTVVCNGVTVAGRPDLVVEQFNANSATLSASLGNVRLFGTTGNDTLTTGAGDDTLVGRSGNDSLNGGAGFNRYLPGPGNDTVTGGSGVDVVFLDGGRSATSLGAGCSRSSCSLSSSAEGSDSLTAVDVLVFTDQIQWLP